MSSAFSPLLQEGARVFGALGPIGPSSPGLSVGGLAVNEHRLSNKLLAWSGVLEWQEVSLAGPSPGATGAPDCLGTFLSPPLLPACRSVDPSRTRQPS